MRKENKPTIKTNAAGDITRIKVKGELRNIAFDDSNLVSKDVTIGSTNVKIEQLETGLSITTTIGTDVNKFLIGSKEISVNGEPVLTKKQVEAYIDTLFELEDAPE